MRIISGKFRGRKLAKSDHLKSSLRPTTDMAREALFNILFSAKSLKEFGFDLNGANVLDLCCGSGAVAFEAISRGAKSATLIDNNRIHIAVAKSNAELLKVESEVKILQADAKKLGPNNEFFDLVFIDPPYKENYLEIVQSALEKKWIQEKSLVVIEFNTSSDLGEIRNLLRKIEVRSYGGTSFGFFMV
jgi:16S rRNA (guanine966-N2)-methyltransferase